MYVNSFDATLNVKQGFPVFSTHVEANHVQKTEDVYAAYKLTDEDIRSIHKLAADKRVGTTSSPHVFLIYLNPAQLPFPPRARGEGGPFLAYYHVDITNVEQ